MRSIKKIELLLLIATLIIKMVVEGILGEITLKIFEIFFGESVKGMQISLYGVFYVVLFSIIVTIYITKYWLKRQVRQIESHNDQKENASTATIAPSSKHYKYISVICGRHDVHQKLFSIIRNAQKGDQIFASCNTCSNYPPEMYPELKNALFNGVKFYGIVRRTKDSEEFISEILRYKNSFPNDIQLCSAQEEIPIRMFGIKHKEVVISLMFKDGFLGIYFQDATFTDLMYSLYKNIKKESINQ